MGRGREGCQMLSTWSHKKKYITFIQFKNLYLRVDIMQQGTFSSQVFTFLLVSSILVLFALLISCLLLSTFFSLNSFILKVRFIHSVIIVRIIYIAPLGKGRVQLYLYILKFCIETAGHDEKICTVDQHILSLH